MGDALRRILDQPWIIVLGSGIALGYTLMNLAQAVGTTIVRAVESDAESEPFGGGRGLLAFTVADHLIDLGELFAWLIAALIVLAVVAFAVSRMRRSADTPP